MAGRPKYALALKRLKQREKALLAELEETRTAISAIAYVITHPPEMTLEELGKRIEQQINDVFDEEDGTHPPPERKPS
jgi:phage gp29-like protein